MIPLSDMKDGQHGAVKEITGGRGIVQRLAEMGISTGVAIKVIRGGGTVILEVKGHRLMIGHGMVDRIMIEPVKRSA